MGTIPVSCGSLRVVRVSALPPRMLCCFSFSVSVTGEDSDRVKGFLGLLALTPQAKNPLYSHYQVTM